LNLSIATVSRALNGFEAVSDETRLRVQDLADELGYERRLGGRQGQTIGLLYSSEVVQTEWGSFEAALLDGIREATHARGWDLVLLSTRQRVDDRESYRQFLRSRNVPGVIVRSLNDRPVTAEAIAAEGVPSVMVANRSDQEGVNYVCTSTGPNTELLIEHLISLGHRRIGIGLQGLLDHDHRSRHDAYVAALRRRGIEPDPALIHTDSALGSPRVGARTIERLLALDEPPTAVFLTDPLSAMGALQRCLALGIRVPEELSIVGIDDSDMRLRTYPEYTAVCQDAGDMGRIAARWLIDRIRGEAPDAL